MTAPRSWNRREFNVAPTGWFTVLKPTGWFSATLGLPAASRYLVGQSQKTGAPTAPASSGQATAIPLEILKPSTREHGLMRSALVVLGACATAWLLLWWLIESQVF
jgi:hypothetical protein